MKKLLTLILLLFVFHAVSAQNQEVVTDASVGYYFDGYEAHNVWIANGNSSDRASRVEIPNQKNHAGTVLYPGDIHRYGVEGKTYVTAAIDYKGELRNVFLEEMFIEEDGTKIYYYCDEKGKDSFIVVNSEEEIIYATQDNPKPMWDFISTNSDCPKLSNAKPFPKKLSYNNVNTFYTAYRDCNSNLFQKLKWGVKLNTGVGVLDTNEVPEYEFDYRFTYSAGLFLRVPLDAHISLQSELLLNIFDNKSGQPKHKGDDRRYKRMSIQLPMLLGYNFTLNNGKTIPYMEAGTLFDFALAGDKYEGGEKLDKDPYSVVDYNSIIKFHWGFSVGAGIQQKLNDRNSLFVGLRWNYSQGNRSDYKEKLKYWQLSIGISL